MTKTENSYLSINTRKDDENEPLLTNKGYLDVSYNNGEFFYQSTDSIDSNHGIFEESNSSLRSIWKSAHSAVSHASILVTLNEKISGDRASSLFMTICNLLPMLQGSAVFGIPFAVMKGGIVFLPAGIILCLLADFTSNLLIECLYEKSPRSKRVKRVYMDIAEVSHACWGPYGASFVNILILVYMTANNVVCVVLMGQCIYDIIGSHVPFNQREVTILFSILLFPPLFIRKLSVLAYISMCGVFSVILGCLVAIGVFIQHYADWSWNYHHIPIFSLEGFPVALSILMYSIILNAILPQIEGTMRNPEQMKLALHISYGISTIFKLTFGFLGALTFGVGTQQLIALNVSQLSVVAKYIITIALCIYAIANFSLMYFVFFEQIDNIMVQRVSREIAIGGKYNWLWMIISRLFVVVLCVAIALVVPFFALVSGVVGAVVATGLTIVFPIVFHLQLKWYEISLPRKCFQIILLMFGFSLGCLTMVSSIYALITAIKNKDQL